MINLPIKFHNLCSFICECKEHFSSPKLSPEEEKIAEENTILAIKGTGREDLDRSIAKVSEMVGSYAVFFLCGQLIGDAVDFSHFQIVIENRKDQERVIDAIWANAINRLSSDSPSIGFRVKAWFLRKGVDCICSKRSIGITKWSVEAIVTAFLRIIVGKSRKTFSEMTKEEYIRKATQLVEWLTSIVDAFAKSEEKTPNRLKEIMISKIFSEQTQLQEEEKQALFEQLVNQQITNYFILNDSQNPLVTLFFRAITFQWVREKVVKKGYQLLCEQFAFYHQNREIYQKKAVIALTDAIRSNTSREESIPPIEEEDEIAPLEAFDATPYHDLAKKTNLLVDQFVEMVQRKVGLLSSEVAHEVVQEAPSYLTTSFQYFSSKMGHVDNLMKENSLYVVAKQYLHDAVQRRRETMQDQCLLKALEMLDKQLEKMTDEHQIDRFLHNMLESAIAKRDNALEEEVREEREMDQLVVDLKSATLAFIDAEQKKVMDQGRNIILQNSFDRENWKDVGSSFFETLFVSPFYYPSIVKDTFKSIQGDKHLAIGYEISNLVRESSKIAKQLQSPIPQVRERFLRLQKSLRRLEESKRIKEKDLLAAEQLASHLLMQEHLLAGRISKKMRRAIEIGKELPHSELRERVYDQITPFYYRASRCMQVGSGVFSSWYYLPGPMSTLQVFATAGWSALSTWSVSLATSSYAQKAWNRLNQSSNSEAGGTLEVFQGKTKEKVVHLFGHLVLSGLDITTDAEMIETALYKSM